MEQNPAAQTSGTAASPSPPSPGPPHSLPPQQNQGCPGSYAPSPHHSVTQLGQRSVGCHPEGVEMRLGQAQPREGQAGTEEGAEGHQPQLEGQLGEGQPAEKQGKAGKRLDPNPTELWGILCPLGHRGTKHRFQSNLQK